MLERTGVPHPGVPRLLCEDRSPQGEFMITDVIDGFPQGFELPRSLDSGLCRSLAIAYADGCAALPKVDWASRFARGKRT
jgi:hypothetical protein